jgi:hypothetical protein
LQIIIGGVGYMTKNIKTSKMPRLGYLCLAFLVLFSSIIPVVHVEAVGVDPFVTKSNGQLPSTAMSGIAYGNGTYVSVGYYGAIIKSTNGKDWVNVKTKSDVNYIGVTNPSSFTFNSVAYGNGIFVAVGSEGVILTSPDGANWTQQVSGTSEYLSRAFFYTFQGTAAFYVATKGKYLTSLDGINWSSVTPSGLSSDYRVTQITVGNSGNRLGVGDEQGNIYSTTDGTTWTKRQPVSPDGFGSIGTNMLTWMNDRYFISDPRGYIWTSTDLLTFTSVGPPFKQTAMQSNNQMFNGIYDGTHYYLFGYQSPYGYGAVYTSVDAVNWQLQPFQKEFVAQMSLYNNGQYFRLGNEGLIMSENGTDWSYLWGGLFNDVIYDGSKYISAGKLGNEGTIWTSTDLSSWKEETISDRIKPLSAIAMGNGKYVAVGEWNNYAGSTSIVTSDDGLTWTTQTGLTDSSSFVDVAFGNGKFVAVGYGSSNSTLKISSDGITWSSPSTLSTNVKNFSSVNYINGRFIALGSEYDNSGNISEIALRVSTDGMVWNDYEISYPSTNEDLKDIIYDGTNYIIVAVDADYKTVIRTSPDLMNWSSPIMLEGYLPYTHALLGQKGSTVYLLANDSSDNYIVYATNDHGVNWQQLAVDFSGQIPASLMSVGNEVIISGDQQLVKSTVTATQQDSQLSETSASFDKKTSAQADVTVSLTLNGNVFSGIKNGATQLQAGMDYEVTGGNVVTIKKEYLAQQGIGVTNLEFEFSSGQAQTLAVTISDSTPQNSGLSETSASFDKKASAQADVTVSLTLNGNMFSGIKNGATQLQAGMDYEVTGGNTVTIKKEYLAQQGIGVTNLDFEFSGGQAQTLFVNITDSTTSVGNPALLVPVTAGDGQASLHWSPINDAIGYKIFVRTDAEPFASEITTLGSDVNSYDITNLVNGTTYYFAVKVVYPEGDSAFSNEQSATPGTVPGAPTGVSAVAGNKQAVVSFTAPLDHGGAPITAYQIKDVDGNVVATGTTSPITIPNLENGKSYIFVVHAINQHGGSIASSQSNAVTPRATSNEGSIDSGGGGTTTPSTPTPSAPSTGTTSPSTTTPVNSGVGVDILVNGKVEKIGTAMTTTNNNRSTTTITANQKLLEEKLEQQGSGTVITIPLNSQSDVVIGELNGQIVKQMEDKQAIVELKTDKATYKLPASQIQVAQLSKQFGSNIDLNNVKIQIETSVATSDQLALAKQAATRGGYSEVSIPLNFEVHAIYRDQKLDVTKFNIYVERSIVLPEGVDPNKITTGVVIEADGTVRHVPTKVTVDAGKYYATVNSLTNSIYSIVWNPIEFKDVANHWAKSEVNNMGSRMVVNGNGEGLFNPNDDITRAEFTAIVVRGLGLKLEKSNASFNDVKSNDWYERVIQTAYANDLITGFEDGSFKPNDKITREQAMTIIAKAMKITGLSKKLEAEAGSSQLQAYRDVTQIADWASQGVADALQARIVTGRDATLLAPKAHTTRAEIAAMIQRLLKQSDLI